MRNNVTFFNLPRVDISDVTKGTIVLIGSTVESKSIHKKYGVGKAVNILRSVSMEYVGYVNNSYALLHDYDIVDLGDFKAKELSKIVRSVINKGGKTVVIGGDHSTTYYSLKEIDFSNLLWLDAHLDLQDETDYGVSSEINHANVLMRIINERRNISVSVLGFRGFSTPKVEIDRAKKLGVNIVNSDETLRELPKHIEEAHAISFDLDFFDASEFSATRVPETKGIRISDFFRALSNIKNRGDIRYMDFVEYCPEIDPGFVNAKILVQIIPLIIGYLLL